MSVQFQPVCYGDRGTLCLPQNTSTTIVRTDIAEQNDAEAPPTWLQACSHRWAFLSCQAQEPTGQHKQKKMALVYLEL